MPTFSHMATLYRRGLVIDNVGRRNRCHPGVQVDQDDGGDGVQHREKDVSP